MRAARRSGRRSLTAWTRQLGWLWKKNWRPKFPPTMPMRIFLSLVGWEEARVGARVIAATRAAEVCMKVLRVRGMVVSCLPGGFGSCRTMVGVEPWRQTLHADPPKTQVGMKPDAPERERTAAASRVLRSG